MVPVSVRSKVLDVVLAAILFPMVFKTDMLAVSLPSLVDLSWLSLTTLSSSVLWFVAS